jgi:uncharacterized repeat protein (TIGR02543 family)
VAEDKNNEEEKFDFTSEGEGYISLAEARVLAVRTAVASPGDYGRQYRGVAMVFEIAESGEDDDFYTVVLSVRPQGTFDGTPGQEQFVVGKEGTVAVRQVLSTPIQTSASPADTGRKGGGFHVIPVVIGLVIVGAIAALGAVFVMMGSGGDSVPIAAVAPTETPTPTQLPAPTETLAPTEMPAPTPTFTPMPTYTPYPTHTPRPTYTPRPTPTPRPNFTLTVQSYPNNGGIVMGGGVYVNGGSATVSATPKQGYTFNHWSGACSGTGRCVVTMNGDKTVTANFSLIPATPTPRPTPTPNAWSYHNKGNEYYDSENWVLAIGEYTRAIGVNPNYTKAYWRRGYSYSKLDQNQNAITDYTKVIQLDPDDNVAYMNRGVSYKNLGQYATAIADYTKSIQLDPDYAKAYQNRGYSYAKLGQYATAIADYTKSIQLDPDYAKAYQNRGYSYAKLGQYATAIADYTKSIQLDPDYANAYLNRGVAYHNQTPGQYQLAITDYTKTIQLDPDYGLAYDNRGIAYRNLGHTTLADSDKTMACSLDSQYC